MGGGRSLRCGAALGASAGRIVRALLLESVWLGLVSGVIGVGFAYAGLRVLVRAAPSSLPRVNEIGIDPRALAFATSVSLLSGLLFGLMPALKYGGPRIAAALHSGGRS